MAVYHLPPRMRYLLILFVGIPFWQKCDVSRANSTGMRPLLSSSQ